jgi:hypothetical protein
MERLKLESAGFAYLRCANQLANVLTVREIVMRSKQPIIEGFPVKDDLLKGMDRVAAGIIEELEAMGCLGLVYDLTYKIQVAFMVGDISLRQN